MYPYQERVVAERNELQDRIIKLRAFMGSLEFDKVDVVPGKPMAAHVPADEQRRLRKQLGLMVEYYEVLNERIHYFTWLT